MAYYLKVGRAFAQYKVGDVITDPTQIASLEAVYGYPFIYEVSGTGDVAPSPGTEAGGKPSPLDTLGGVVDVSAFLATFNQRSANLSDLQSPDKALSNINALDRRVLRLTSDPGSADIPLNTIRVVKNTTTGRLSLYANDGGTLVDLLTLATS